MKERPILFSAPMIRALLAGKKTQTRRIAKWRMRPGQEGLNLGFSGLEAGLYSAGNAASGYVLRSRDGNACWNDRTFPLHCPYGVPGDRLWVKETWTHDSDSDDEARAHHEDAMASCAVFYRADMTDQEAGIFTRWRPSIFMPRWASRITLENTEVRLQRLHDITEEDAEAEGVEFFDGMYEAADLHRSARLAGCSHEDARAWFAWAWDHINGDRAPWVTDPWVWAVSFPPVTA